MSVAVLLGAQWGDEGKGKLIDFLIDQEKVRTNSLFVILRLGIPLTLLFSSTSLPDVKEATTLATP